MICCIDCFGSNYIKDLIRGGGEIGDCNFCGSVGIHTLPVNSDVLSRVIGPFSGIYKVNASSTLNLYESIFDDFPGRIISKKLTRTQGVDLLKKILPAEEETLQNVSLAIDNSIRLTSAMWDRFTEELKTVNRFHITNALVAGDLKTLFENYNIYTIPAGTTFYRARKGRKQLAEMGMPPVEKTNRGGRINPIGIPYLYLSDTVETTFYETRSTMFDQVSVAKFILSEGINVYDLRKDSTDLGFIAEQETLEYYIPYFAFIKRLEEEMSKPNLETEKEIDYLPTQYIAEYLKFLGHVDGILYSSSLHPDGYNLALFKSDKVVCEEVEYHKIIGVNFRHELLP